MAIDNARLEIVSRQLAYWNAKLDKYKRELEHPNKDIRELAPHLIINANEEINKLEEKYKALSTPS